MRNGAYTGSISQGCLILFGLPFLGAGIAVLFFAGRSWSVYLDSAGWPEVPATIEHAEFVSHSGDDSTTYSVDCRYSYAYEGERYTGTRVAPMGGSSSEYELHQRRYAILAEHMRSGTSFPALVNPERPDFAFLFREADLFMYIGIPFGLVFALAGAGVMTGGVVATRRARRRAAARDEFGDRPWLFRADWREFRSVPAAGAGLAAAWAAGLGLPLFISAFVVVFVLGDAPVFAKVIVGIFAAMAAGAFLNAVVVTLRFVLHGAPVLVMSRVPFVPGGRLIAVVQAHGHLDPEGVSMHLTIHETTRGQGPAARHDLGGGKTSSLSTSSGNSTTREIYRQPMDVDPSMVTYDGRNTLLPVAFDIPAHLPPCAKTGDDLIAWRLAVKVRAMPVSLRAKFDLPVFEAEESEIMTREGAVA